MPQWERRIRFSVTFSLRVQRGSDIGSLVACVLCSGQRMRYSMGYSHIPVRHWDAARQRMLPRSPRADEINREIDRHIEVILSYFSSANPDSIEPPTLGGLQARLFPRQTRITTHSEKHSVIGLFKRFIREHTNGGVTQSSPRQAA